MPLALIWPSSCALLHVHLVCAGAVKQMKAQGWVEIALDSFTVSIALYMSAMTSEAPAAHYTAQAGCITKLTIVDASHRDVVASCEGQNAWE